MSLEALLRFFYTIEVQRLSGAPLQAGALCWRRSDSGIEILLVTSRRSGKWGVPKGWTLRGRPLHRTAAQEAWEEAGVIGQAENHLLGFAGAPKRYRLIGEIGWKVALYPLAVERLADDWPERGLRARRWFPVEEAARLVRPRSLAPLLRSFTYA